MSLSGIIQQLIAAALSAQPTEEEEPPLFPPPPPYPLPAGEWDPLATEPVAAAPQLPVPAPGTPWEQGYKGDDPQWEAYLRRLESGQLMGYEIHRLSRGFDPATGRGLQPSRSDWPQVLREARKRRFDVRGYAPPRAQAPTFSWPPPSAGPSAPSYPWPLPGVEPEPRPVRQMPLPPSSYPGAGMEPPPFVGGVNLQAPPPMPGLPPIYPGGPPMPAPRPTGPLFPGVTMGAGGLLGGPAITPQAPGLLTPGAGLEFLRGQRVETPQLPIPGQEPGWEMPGPEMRPLITPQEQLALAKGAEERRGQVAAVVRRGNQWAVENIPGVGLVEGLAGRAAGAVAGIAKTGGRALIDFFMQFPYAVERGAGWATMQLPLSENEQLMEDALETNKFAYLQTGGDEEAFESEIRPGLKQFRQDLLEYRGWLRTLPTEDYYRVLDETSRIYYSGPESQLAAGQEIFGAMQEARTEGREITDEEVTSILQTHEDWGAEMFGQFMLDPFLWEMFVGAPLSKAVWGLAKLPLKVAGKGLKITGATVAWGERVVSGSKFTRYMVENHPILSEVIENTVKYVPRKFRGGLNWLKAQTAQSVARGMGLRARDVAMAVGAPPEGQYGRTIQATRELLTEVPGEGVLGRLSRALEAGKTGSPIHDDLLARVIGAVGGQDEFEKVIRAARRGTPLGEMTGAQVAELIGHQTQLAILGRMGVNLETSGAGRATNWLRRLWVEAILFSRPGWAVINEATNILYGTLEGYDMFGNLDDISKWARLRRSGIPPGELFETGLISEETLKPLGLESKLALEEIPFVGKPLSKWPKAIAWLWESGEQGARTRIWAKASDLKYSEEVAKIREVVFAFPEEMQPEVVQYLKNIYDNSSTPQAFRAGADDLLESLRPAVLEEGAAGPTLGIDLLNYPDPMPGGYPYPSIKEQVGDELAGAYKEGRLTHETADLAFAGGYYGLEDEAAGSLAAIYGRAPTDTQALQEIALQEEMWLPFWDDLSPEDQSEILRKAHEYAIARSVNRMEFESMSHSAILVAPDDMGKNRVTGIRMSTFRESQHLYSDTRIKANELLRSYQRGLMSASAYREATDDLWRTFNIRHREILGGGVGELDNFVLKSGPAPKPLRGEKDLLGKMLGQGNDTTSRMGKAFANKFPGSTGRVIKSHRFHWVIQIEEGPARGAWIYVQKGKLPKGVDLAGVMHSIPLDATADDLVRGIPGNRWNEAIDSVNKQYALGKDELAKWQAYVHAQIDQAPAEIQDATSQLRLAELWANDAYGQLAGASVASDKHGIAEAHRILFNYLVDSNLDALARKIIPFWKWPSRNLPMMAGIVVKNPELPLMYGRYMDISDHYVHSYNATERMRGYIPLPGTEGQIWINPLAIPFQSFSQLWRPWRSYEEEEPIGVQIMRTASRVGFTPAPWITGFRVGETFVPGILNLAAGVAGKPEIAPRRQDVWQIAPQIQLLAPLIDKFFGTELAPTPVWHPYLVRRRVAEWGAEGRVSPVTGEPITEEEALAASNDPTGELWMAADKDVKWEYWKASAAGYFTGLYPKAFSPGEQAIRGDLAEYQEIPSMRSDLQRIFLEEHWWLKTYWDAFGPEDEMVEKYMHAWQEEDRLYPGKQRAIGDADVQGALQDADHPLRLVVEGQITMDTRDRERRLAELQEQLARDLATITPERTKAYEDRLEQFYADREAVYADYPLLEEDFAPGAIKPLNLLMRMNAQLSAGLFDEEGEYLVEDAPKQYMERRNFFRRQLEMISSLLEPLMGFSLLDEFDVRKARYEDPTQAAYNAFERLYLNPAASIIFDDEASDEEKEEARQWVLGAHKDKAGLAAEIARVHPDWTPKMVTAALETSLPDFDTWMRRNNSLKDALWSVVWGGYMDLPAIDRREFQEFIRTHPDAGPQVVVVFEEAMLPKEIEVGGKIWERDRADISIPILTILADKLKMLKPLGEEGFDIDTAAQEAGLRGFGEEFEPSEPYEPVPAEVAVRYDRWRQLTSWYYDLPEGQRPEDFWDRPEVSALAGEFQRDTPLGKARDRFWNTYDYMPPRDEIRDDPLIAAIIKERNDNPERETKGVSFTAEQYDEAARRLEARKPEWGWANPEEIKKAKEVYSYIWETINNTPGTRDESGEMTEAGWDMYNSFRDGYAWILDKYYPRGGRAPGKQYPPQPGEPPGPEEAPGPSPRIPAGKTFEQWAEERRGLSRDELYTQEIGAQGRTAIGHPSLTPFRPAGEPTPASLEQEARQSPDYEEYLSAAEVKPFRDWVFKEAGFTPQAQKELGKLGLRVKRSVAGGGGWGGDHIELGSPGLEGAIHEYAHAHWDKRRRKQGSALVEAVKQLAEETDPQYEIATELARIYIRGDPETGFRGMRLSESALPREVWGYGPEDEWNDHEMFAGLASGVMGHIEWLPPYIQAFYRGLFSGETGKYATRTNREEPYADFWPAMAIRAKPGQIRDIAGPEILEDIRAGNLSEPAVSYLFSLFKRYGQGSFEEWINQLQ